MQCYRGRVQLSASQGGHRRMQIELQLGRPRTHSLAPSARDRANNPSSLYPPRSRPNRSFQALGHQVRWQNVMLRLPAIDADDRRTSGTLQFDLEETTSCAACAKLPNPIEYRRPDQRL